MMFGAVSTALGRRELATAGQVAPSAASALGDTFLIMLVTLIIAALLLLCVARRTYPRDVATAMASELLSASEGAESYRPRVRSQVWIRWATAAHPGFEHHVVAPTEAVAAVSGRLH
jgi:hypothetical protein